MAWWKRGMLVIILLTSITTMASNSASATMGKIDLRHKKQHSPSGALTIINETSSEACYCLSWRMAVEANNMRGWRTIPTQCWRYIQSYMVGGQYSRDINLIIDQIYDYINSVTLLGDGFDAWVFDVDDTCLSNLIYYQAKRFGCYPYNPIEFKTWALKGMSPAIPEVLGLFNRLVDAGFKVMLITGRDEETLGDVTTNNLFEQGYIGFERLIMRSPEYRGLGAMMFKSAMRTKLKEQGYRIWGNVGDQWSDLQGNFTGDRTFKLPNPMYFVP